MNICERDNGTDLNWQLNDQSNLTLVLATSSCKEEDTQFESTVLKLNRTASLILALLDNGSTLQGVTKFLKDTGYLIREKHEKKIANFINRLADLGIIEILNKKYTQFPLPLLFLSRAYHHFENPRILLYKKFSGLPHEKWSINLGRYASWSQFFHPIKVNFEITHNCNLHCKYCYLTDEGVLRYEDLPFDKVKQIIDRLKEAQVQLVNLFGGEPFLRKDIFEIIEYIKKAGMQVTINTNGTLLEDEVVDRLKAMGIYSLHISLDAATSETFEIMRDKSVFDLVLRNIKRAVCARLPLQINFTVTRVNFMELPRVYRLVQRLGIQTLSIGSFSKIGCGMKNKDIFEMNYLLYFCWVKLLQFIFSFGKTLFYIKERCDANIYTYLDYQGYIHFCTLIPRTMPLGNLLEEDLLKLWHSDRYKSLFNLDYVKEPCRSCLFERHCHKGCRAEFYAKEKDFFAGNTYCIRGKVSQKIHTISSYLKNIFHF